jgi:hypothetical protein
MSNARARGALILVLLTVAVPSLAQDAGYGAGPRSTMRRPSSMKLQQQGQTARKVQMAREARQRELIARAQGAAAARRKASPREFSAWPEVTERVVQTLHLGKGGTFELQNAAGDVVIHGGRGADVRVEAMKRARHRTPSLARTLLPQMHIEIVERGGSVQLRTEQPPRRGAWTAVDYLVTVPSGANVVLDIGSGNVHVTGVHGELRADTANGNLTATDVRRVRHMRTMRGNIEVSDAAADELSANTVEGDLLLRNLKGRSVDMNSVNGDLRLVDVEISRARLQTMAGDIDYAGPLARSGRYELATHSGSIRLHPTGDAGFDLEAHTFAGDIRSDYTLKQIADAVRKRSQRMMRGTFGDAGAMLTTRTFSGDIRIVRR